MPEVSQDHSPDQFHRAIAEARETAAQNVAGLVVRVWDVSSDAYIWVFGHHHFPVLTGTGGRMLPGDTMAGRQDCPLEEFHAYLKAFYWPRRREMDAAA